MLFLAMQSDGAVSMGRDVPKTIELKVHFAQDAETGLWYIAASDIPGLRVEAESVQELLRKVEDVAPDLIDLNSDEILARYRAASRAPTSRPPFTLLPVFDSPLSVAAA